VFEIFNNSGLDLGPLEELIQEFMPFAQERHGFKRPPKLFLLGDEENAANPLGKTGGYNPDTMEITIYVSGRHPKDILRSVSHELVHHNQCCRGDLDDIASTAVGYAQEDEHMREMEREAYEQGNLCFRDWEDGRKKQLSESIYYETVITEDGGEDMSNKEPLKEWKDNEINSRLMKKFGLVKEAESGEADSITLHDENTGEKRAGDVVTEDDDDDDGGDDDGDDDDDEDSSEPDEPIGESLNGLINESKKLLKEQLGLATLTGLLPAAIGGTTPSGPSPIISPRRPEPAPYSTIDWDVPLRNWRTHLPDIRAASVADLAAEEAEIDAVAALFGGVGPRGLSTRTGPARQSLAVATGRPTRYYGSRGESLAPEGAPYYAGETGELTRIRAKRPQMEPKSARTGLGLRHTPEQIARIKAANIAAAREQGMTDVGPYPRSGGELHYADPNLEHPTFFDAALGDWWRGATGQRGQSVESYGPGYAGGILGPKEPGGRSSAWHGRPPEWYLKDKPLRGYPKDFEQPGEWKLNEKAAAWVMVVSRMEMFCDKNDKYCRPNPQFGKDIGWYLTEYGAEGAAQKMIDDYDEAGKTGHWKRKLPVSKPWIRPTQAHEIYAHPMPRSDAAARRLGQAAVARQLRKRYGESAFPMEKPGETFSKAFINAAVELALLRGLGALDKVAARAMMSPKKAELFKKTVAAGIPPEAGPLARTTSGARASVHHPIPGTRFVKHPKRKLPTGADLEARRASSVHEPAPSVTVDPKQIYSPADLAAQAAARQAPVKLFDPRAKPGIDLIDPRKEWSMDRIFGRGLYAGGRRDIRGFEKGIDKKFAMRHAPGAAPGEPIAIIPPYSSPKKIMKQLQSGKRLKGTEDRYGVQTMKNELGEDVVIFDGFSRRGLTQSATSADARIEIQKRLATLDDVGATLEEKTIAAKYLDNIGDETLDRIMLTGRDRKDAGIRRQWGYDSTRGILTPTPLISQGPWARFLRRSAYFITGVGFIWLNPSRLGLYPGATIDNPLAHDLWERDIPVGETQGMPIDYNPFKTLAEQTQGGRYSLVFPEPDAGAKTKVAYYFYDMDGTLLRKDNGHKRENFSAYPPITEAPSGEEGKDYFYINPYSVFGRQMFGVSNPYGSSQKAGETAPKKKKRQKRRKGTPKRDDRPSSEKKVNLHVHDDRPLSERTPYTWDDLKESLELDEDYYNTLFEGIKEMWTEDLKE